MHRRDGGYDGERMLKIELPGIYGCSDGGQAEGVTEEEAKEEDCNLQSPQSTLT